MHNQNNEQYKKSNMSPVAAGITGLILGIVGTAAIALSDKNTRTKVTKKATSMKENLEKWSKDTLHDLQATGEDVKKRAAEKSDQIKTQSETSSDELKERADDVLTGENKKDF